MLLEVDAQPLTGLCSADQKVSGASSSPAQDPDGHHQEDRTGLWQESQEDHAVAGSWPVQTGFWPQHVEEAGLERMQAASLPLAQTSFGPETMVAAGPGCATGSWPSQTGSWTSQTGSPPNQTGSWTGHTGSFHEFATSSDLFQELENFLSGGDDLVIPTTTNVVPKQEAARGASGGGGVPHDEDDMMAATLYGEGGAGGSSRLVPLGGEMGSLLGLLDKMETDPMLQAGLRIRSIFGRIRQIRILKSDPGSYWPLKNQFKHLNFFHIKHTVFLLIFE